MKKLLAFLLIASICLFATGCEQSTTAPDELQTPQYAVSEALELPEPEESEIHTSQDGIKIISPNNEEEQEAEQSASPDSLYVSEVTPETIWDDDSVVTYNSFTMPEKAAFDNGSLGVLAIGKIGLSVNVFESDDQMEDMSKGAAHFKSTSAWDGNVCLSAHNMTSSGYGAFFKDLHKLSAGDSIFYKTALGEREYTVTTVKTISDSDWSALSRTSDNRLTLITCVNNDASKRLLVQATQR